MSLLHKFDNMSVISIVLSLKVDYPSALTSFEAITDLAGSKRLVLFLDYDGTLSPIVDNPENALMSDEVNLHQLLLFM